MLLPWSKIATVFLDMDGTLLDLHFDNYFWLEYLPARYGEVHDLPLDEAKQQLFQQFAKHQGQLTWYCIDYWTDVLQLPIIRLKQDIAHLIQWREQAEFFLKKLKQMGKKTILITNAHPESLALKMQRINLASWFDGIISSHQLGYPKESQYFWHMLQKQIDFTTTNTLFIDDSVGVLRSAKKFGIAHLAAIYQPDSQQPPCHVQHEFDAIKNFSDCFVS